MSTLASDAQSHPYLLGLNLEVCQNLFWGAVAWGTQSSDTCSLCVATHGLRPGAYPQFLCWHYSPLSTDGSGNSPRILSHHVTEHWGSVSDL